jgi:hypothetical protein
MKPERKARNPANSTNKPIINPPKRSLKEKGERFTPKKSVENITHMLTSKALIGMS